MGVGDEEGDKMKDWVEELPITVLAILLLFFAFIAGIPMIGGEAAK